MNIKLPKELITVTKTSKILAAILFITLPFLGFFAGMNYQQTLNSASQTTTNEPILPKRTPLPSEVSTKEGDPSQTIETVDASTWKTYTNSEYGYSFKYPDNWYIDTSYLKVDGSTRFFTTGEKASYTYQMAKGNEQLIISIRENQKFEELEKQLNLNTSPITIQGKEGKKALKYTTGAYILLDSSKMKILSLYMPIYTPEKNYLDQILSTFKFLP